ncbi:glycosyltransferase family 29 protein [Campylobacter sp. IFREMER_LSEM_CL2151]|uniref:glycosyltransferase family 29 protein n=1 Tax=Campylobacter sp. IFREMER_LSEM_CL2151 TaxID=2911620 RepID=UPI0021E77CAD|nr:glycosyltransferase family 29 protein [Campylobacter sp. IFREMER_LSEM_CL2151]MCV3376282.1 glycosyltransferase family 29 protein [Campylobacter sp. IFREMER_LSEM_CL2151]
MNKILLTIIVPCYNKERYIENAFKCLIEQKCPNVEIIFIDDCSTDSTLSKLKGLCEQFKDDHNKYIRVFANAKNRGYGYTVNMGIKKSKGKYISIFEPDDEVPEFYYLILLKQICKYSMEIVFYDTYQEVRDCFKNRTINMFNPGYSKNNYQEMSNDDIERRLCLGNVGICMGIYDKNYVVSNNFFLNENSRGYEDAVFIALIMSRATKVKIIPGGGYRYRKDDVVQSTNDPKNFYKILPTVSYVLENIEKNLRYPAVLGYLLNHLKTYYDKTRATNNNIIANQICLLVEKMVDNQSIKCNARVAQFIKNITTNCKEIHIVENYTPLVYQKTAPLSSYLDQDFSIMRSYAYLKFYLIMDDGVEKYSQNDIYSILNDILVFSNIPNTDNDQELKRFLKFFLNSVSLDKINKNKKVFNDIIMLCRSLGIFINTKNYIYENNFDFFDNMLKINELVEVEDFKCINFFLDTTRKNEVELRKYLHQKRIAVVGNSPCELNKNRGEEIDSHDVVIRFNNFSSNLKFHRDYGVKTNIWVVTPALNSIFHKSSLKDFDYVVAPICNRKLPLDQYKVLSNWLYAGVKITRIQCINYLVEYDIRVMSLGLIMINYILDKIKYNELNFYGFSLRDQVDGVSHYFNNDPSSGKILAIHKWEEEAKIFDKIKK